MIKEIELRNYRGFRYCNLRLGEHQTLIIGGNGTGKTSLAMGLRHMFTGGYDPGDVNDPAAEGGASIVIGEEPPPDLKKFPPTKAFASVTFEDGSYARRVVDKTRRTNTIDYYSATGERIGGQEEIEKLLNPDAIDPLKFLAKDTKDHVKFVEKFLEVPLAIAEVQAIVPGDWWHAHFQSKGQCFEKLGAITKACEERRRTINREKDQMDATIQNLRKGVIYINEENQDWAGAEEATGKAYREAEAAYMTAKGETDTEAAAARRQIDTKLQTDNATVDAWEQSEIRRIRGEAEAKRQENKATRDACALEIQRLTAERLAEIEREHQPIVLDTAKDHAAAKEDLKKYNEMSGLREHLANLDKEFQQRMLASANLDKAIEALRILRKEKADQVPIPGLTMPDGKIHYQGVALEHINSAMRTQIAACILTQSQRRFMIIDDAEHLEPDVRAEFISQLVAAGIQVVVCEVVPGPLRVTTS